MSYTSLLILVLIPVIAFLIHLIGLRFQLWKSFSGQKSSIVSIVMAIGVCFFVYLITDHSPTPISILYFIILSPLLGHLYFQAFCLSETARRIRILVAIQKGCFKPEALAYDPVQMVQIRLERLLQLNSIALKDGYYRSKPTFLTYFAVFLRLYERVLFANFRNK